MAIPFCLPSDEETEDNYRRLEQLLVDIYDVLRIIMTRQQSNQFQAIHTNLNHEINTSNDNHVSQLLPQQHHHQHQQQLQNYEQEDSSFRITNRSIDDVHRRIAQLPDIVLSTLPSHSNNQSNILISSSDSIDGTIQNRLNISTPKVPPRKYKKKSKKSISTISSCQKSNLNKSITETDQSWVQVGKELRNIADDFRMTYKEANKGKEPIDLPELKASSLFALLLPTPLLNRSVWTTVLFIVGWKMLLRQR